MDDGPGRPGHLTEETGLFAVEGGHLQQKLAGILHNIHSQLFIGYNDRLEQKQIQEIPVGQIYLINSFLTVNTGYGQHSLEILAKKLGRHRPREIKR